MTEPARILLLGPLQLRNEAGEIPLRGTKLRALLALLSLSHGRTVSTQTIRAVLWGDAPPLTADNAVQVYVASLRKVLRALGDARIVLETVPHGYRLQLPPGVLDRDDFDRACTDAASAAAAGLPESVAAHLRIALSAWRGTALGELALSEGLADQARELDRRELDAYEAYVENELTLGHHRDVIVALERRARQHPLRESLWALLALALYRSDLQAEALAALRTVRGVLDDELGVAPGERLRGLEVSILRHDPALRAQDDLPGSAAAAGPRPAPLRAVDRTVPDPRSDLPTPPLHLVLADGTAVTSDRTSILVGRDPGCDVVLTRASVSARHARIVATAHGHAIEDLGSTNGTYVNGEPVNRRILAPGDLIELGREPLRYNLP